MKKRITIKDIARELNVHHSTVSRALRNDPRVNIVTRDEVLAFALAHDYQTNMNAVQLRGTHNNAIALIVPDIKHSFFSDVVSKLTSLAFDKGYVISVFQTDESYLLEKQIVDTIIQHNFAGVVVSISKNSTEPDHFQLLQKFGIPVVFFDRVSELVAAPKVVVNNYEITVKATEYLISKGYKRIVHLTGTNNINVFRDRQNGYLDSLMAHQFEFRQPIIVEDDFSVEIGRSVFSRLWNSAIVPDAIISSSVHLTTGIVLEAKKYDVKIPQELGVITFGTTLAFDVVEPKISYIEQPEMDIAEIAFGLLEKMILKEIEIDSNMEHTVQANFILRESC